MYKQTDYWSMSMTTLSTWEKTHQLCQAIIQPHILNSIQESKHSTSFSLFNQNGTFNVIDTCNDVTDGKCDIYLKLVSKDEARYIVKCPYIRTQLTRLCTENLISDYVEKGKYDFSDQFSKSIDYEKR